MTKRFITHKRHKKKYTKLFFFIIIIYVTCVIVFNFLLKNKLNNYLSNTNNQINFVNLGLNNNKISLDLLNPRDIFKLSLNYLLDSEEQIFHFNDQLILNKDNNDDNPRIYIYNTHQIEGYDSNLLQAYNITYTVETASFILRDYLKEYGIPCFVETNSMSDYLNTNGLLYKNSYEASRHYILKRMKEYNTIDFLIDLHRDSAKGSVTKVNIDGKSYAKVLFVVGLDHIGYESNLKLAEILNSKLDLRLTRGISKKTGANVNGIYNQDLSKNSILLEIGGVDNTIEEVNNTLKIIAKILFEYLNGEL